MRKNLLVLLGVFAMTSLFCGSAYAESTEEQNASTMTSDYFTIPASRDESVEIPVGVTLPADLEEGEACPVVIMVHGFLGNKDEFGFYCNSVFETDGFPSIAEELAARGIGTIRIDQAGCGDSQDDFRNYTMSNSVSDLEDAYAYCMDQYSFDPEEIGLVGWSLGGKYGPQFASTHDEISAMVLLNPAGDNGNTSLLTAAGVGLDWEVLEPQIENGELVTEFYGEEYHVSEDFFKQIDESTTGDLINAYVQDEDHHALMIYGDKDSIINPETYKWMIENSGIQYVCIPDMDHDLGLESGRPDYTNTVIDETVAYLASFLNY